MNTAERLRAHLADPKQYFSYHVLPEDLHDRGFSYMLIRNRFETSNGYRLSIQQSATHYSHKDENTFELGFVPPSKLLEDYSDGEYSPIYGYVPFDLVVAYIDELEAKEPNKE